jgi:hypothetical protein
MKFFKIKEHCSGLNNSRNCQQPYQEHRNNYAAPNNHQTHTATPRLHQTVHTATPRLQQTAHMKVHPKQNNKQGPQEFNT